MEILPEPIAPHPGAAKSITLYGGRNDPVTAKAKEFMDKLGINYIFEDLKISDPKKIEQLHAKSHLEGQPQLDVCGKFILGFTEEKYKEAFGLTKKEEKKEEPTPQPAKPETPEERAKPTQEDTK